MEFEVQIGDGLGAVVEIETVFAFCGEVKAMVGLGPGVWRVWNVEGEWEENE